MADDTNTPLDNGGSEDSGRGRREGAPREIRQRDGGQRSGGQRDAGGFRIRLSDNELQAARALQEAFGLRSTVAVLGFALRTLAQQLEAGQLQDLVAQQRTQAAQRPPAARGGGERDDRRGEGRSQPSGGGGRAQRIDPFARPSRPAPAKAEAEVLESEATEQFDKQPAPDQSGSEAGSAVIDQADPAGDAAVPEASAPGAEAAAVSAGEA
ncbi:MAG: hypothetical protein WCQ20_09690 [Synechococcaceae cyanobacterium ELA739]